jgi:hypothetical protein
VLPTNAPEPDCSPFLLKEGVSGFEDMDVGDRIYVQLIAMGVEQGYIDFRKVASSRHW